MTSPETKTIIGVDQMDRGIRVNLPGFKRQRVEVIPPGFFKGLRLLLNGQPAPRSDHRGEFLLTDDKGQTVKARFRNQAFGLDYPQLKVGRESINIVDPLKWYWWMVAVLPLLLVTFGAGLGGLIGLISAWINVRLLRQPWHWLARLGAVLGVDLLSLFTWFMIYSLLFREKSG
jgi:hypothetical protein